MKRQHYQRILSATLLAVLGTISLGAANTFADGGEDYGITYSTSGAQPLGGGSPVNVQENADLVNGLTPLISAGLNQSQTVFSGGWSEGNYWDSNLEQCRPIRYFRVPNLDATPMDGQLSFSISNNSYLAEVSIEDASLIPTTTSIQQPVTVGVVPGNSWIYGGLKIYRNNDCDRTNGQLDSGKDSKVENVSTLSVSNNEDVRHLFVKTNIKLYRVYSNTPLSSNQLYFGLTDIDAAQSYKILNSDSLLEPSNMFAKDLADLQQAGSILKNYYVPTGNYIFSEYDNTKSGADAIVSTPDISNIYVKLGEETQEEGLDIVFGFTTNAASGIEYYAKQYKVIYNTDGNGKIININNGKVAEDNEQVISDQNPSGRNQTPNDGYSLTHWTVDREVTLEDGTTIEAGSIITEEEITQVVVDQDNITFTAHYAKLYTVTYESDENGSITGITSEDVAENDNPAGTDQASKTGYTLSHWIADVDVVLEDGTEIKKGDPITTEQISQVVVTEDITFTAIHIPKVATPDTGTISKGLDAAQIVTLSVFGITACGLAVKYLPRAMRRKVKFDK